MPESGQTQDGENSIEIRIVEEFFVIASAELCNRNRKGIVLQMWGGESGRSLLSRVPLALEEQPHNNQIVVHGLSCDAFAHIPSAIEQFEYLPPPAL